MIQYELHEFLELFDSQELPNNDAQHAIYEVTNSTGNLFTINLEGPKNRAVCTLQDKKLQQEPLFEIEITDLGKITTDQKELRFYKQKKMAWHDEPCLIIQIKPTISFSHTIR